MLAMVMHMWVLSIYIFFLRFEKYINIFLINNNDYSKVYKLNILGKNGQLCVDFCLLTSLYIFAK